MKTSRLFSSLMIAALLFVVFHDFAVNKVEAPQESSYISLQDALDKDDSDMTVEHQSFHQPFLVTADTSLIYSRECEGSHPHDSLTYKHQRSFDIYSPPKA